MARITRIDPSPTIRAMNAAFKDKFIHRWDARMSPLQEISRTTARAALGQKKSPTGRGRNRSRGR
jgi:hypothetical protein